MDEDPPTIERRIEAALALRGMKRADLSRVLGRGYSERNLARIVSSTTPREADDRDLRTIAKACRVSDAFWTVDFTELEEASLRATVTDLRHGLRELTSQVAQHRRALRELLGRDPEEEPEADDPQ